MTQEQQDTIAILTEKAQYWFDKAGINSLDNLNAFLEAHAKLVDYVKEVTIGEATD